RHAGHPQPYELPPQADSERQTAEEDQRDRRDFRQREGGAGTVSERTRNAGDLHGHEGEGGIGRLRSWGEKPGPPPTVKWPRDGITIRQPRRNSSRSAS